MNGKTKTILVSVVVIALALTAVSGVTYSWFTDEQSQDVTVTTGVVDIEKGVITPVNDSVDYMHTVVNGDGSVSIENLMTGTCGMKIPVTNNSTVPVLYRVFAVYSHDAAVSNEGEISIAMNGGNTVTLAAASYTDDLITGVEGQKNFLLKDWTLVPKAKGAIDDLMISVIGSDAYTSPSVPESFKLTIKIQAIQGNYVPPVVSNNSVEGGVSGAITADTNIVSGVPAADVEVAEEDKLSNVTIVFDSSQAQVADNKAKITQKSEPSGGAFKIGNSDYVLELKLVGADGSVKDSTAIGNTKVTVLVPGIIDDPQVHYVGEAAQPTVDSYRYVNGNTEVTFTTQHFSEFIITADKYLVDGTGAATVYDEDDLKAAVADKVLIIKFGSDICISNPSTPGSGLRPDIDIDSAMTIDMNKHKLFREEADRFVNGVPAFFSIVEPVEVKIIGSGTMDAELGDNSSYCINVNHIDAVLNIENGTFLGAPTGIQVQKGTLNVSGGTFDLASSCKVAAPGMAKYEINCIDGSFKDGTAKINVTGGTFVNFDPSADPENVGASYVAENHVAVLQDNGNYIVKPAISVDGKAYGSLQTAIDDAKPGSNIILNKDLVLNEGVPADSRYDLFVNKDVTIIGNGHTVTNGLVRGIGVQAQNVTFKDLTINNAIAYGRGIDTRGNIGTFTLDGVTINTTGPENCQSLTIGGDQDTNANIVLNNCTLNSGADGYCILMFNPVNLTVTGGTLNGWGIFYFKGPSGSAGTDDSVILADGCKIVSNNDNSGKTNSFGAIVYEDVKNNTVTLKDCVVEVSTTGDQTQELFCFNNGWNAKNNTNVITGNTVVTISGLGLITEPEIEVTNSVLINSGKFNVDPTAYLAEGYQCTQSGETWIVSPVPATAPTQ